MNGTIYKGSTNLKTFITLLIILAAIVCAKSLALATAATQTSTEERKLEPGERKLEPGQKVVVRTQFSRINVAGWERDTIKATIKSEGRTEASGVKFIEEGGKIIISPITESRRSGSNTTLEIRLPRSAVVESIGTGLGDVEASDLENTITVSTAAGKIKVFKVGALNAISVTGDISAEAIGGKASISTTSGNIKARRIGTLDIQTRNGEAVIGDVNGTLKIQSYGGSVTAENVKGDFIAKVMSGDLNIDDVGGLVNVIVTSGNLFLRNASSDVRAVSISGDMDIHCVKGRAEISCASGSITLGGISGDIEAVTVSGDVSFNGVIRPGGRYKMKSTTGEVRMAIQPDAPGFAATLSSYNGAIETAFPLKVETGPLDRRIIGRYGDGQTQNGQTQITLDSFNGTVNLNKTKTGTPKGCQ